MRSPAPALLRPALRWLAAAVAATALVSGCDPSPSTLPSSSPPSPPPKMGLTVFAPAHRKPVPALAGPTLDGTRLDLSALRGHVVVVNVWASWCRQCRSESTMLAALSARLGGRGVRFVGLDERDLAHKARAFAARTGLDYPHLIDAYGTLLAKLTMLPRDTIPSTLVIDSRGRAAARVIGEIHPQRLLRVVRRVARGS